MRAFCAPLPMRGDTNTPYRRQMTRNSAGGPPVSLLVLRLSDVDRLLIARSEARNILVGALGFAEVDLDFEGVEQVGQGFVDEAFRSGRPNIRRSESLRSIWVRRSNSWSGGDPRRDRADSPCSCVAPAPRQLSRAGDSPPGHPGGAPCARLSGAQSRRWLRARAPA